MAKASQVQVLAHGARSRVASWLEVTEQGYLQYPFGLIRAVVGLPKWVWLVVVALVVGSVVSFGTTADVPKSLSVGHSVSRAVDNGVNWMVVNWDPFFRAINTNLLQHVMVPLENWLLRLPWWVVIVVVVLLSYRLVGLVFALVSASMMMALAAFGLFDLAMITLAIILVSTTLALILGVPTGIAMAKSHHIDAVIRPTLDLMQTMPSFVYLIPVLMLFGLGKVPAVIAVVIYAVAPIVRLTSLGIRQVDGSVVEAATAFGATSTQILLKVQLPLAMPTIMAGLNQTIMMALAMVVIASMIGAKGLGVEVLNGIARLEVGRGLLGGVGIVIMAVILDRLTQALAKPRRPASARA